MKIIFFTEAGNESGYGHLMRCYALFGKFISNGIIAELKITGSKDLSRIIQNLDYSQFIKISERLDLSDFDYADILVIDSYLIASETINLIKKKSKLTVCFDDYNRINYGQDALIINGAINAEKLQYDSKSLLGIKYFPLRGDFFPFRNSYVVKDKVLNILN